MFQIDNPHNNLKNVIHAFFLALAITIAEPSTILPLMVHHFSESMIVVGLFASLFRGGSIIVQLYVAFHAQAYRRVLPSLRWVFFFRWLAWFLIGVSILLLGESHKIVTLFFIGVGLFFFSFMAGFGTIYFKELQAKLFSKAYRGKTMANRQVAGSIASIMSGGVAGYVLHHYEAPQSYGYLFILSSLFMVIGFITFATIQEPEKKQIAPKEKHFKTFLVHAIALFKNNRQLQRQTLAIFLSLSYSFSMPFVILQAHDVFYLSGWILGGFISVQMVGSIIGSSLLWRNISDYTTMLSLGFLIMIFTFILPLFLHTLYGYALIFFLFGIALDGFKIAGMNLIIEIAPEAQRPLYTALQTNLSSLGLFFPLLGGILLKYIGIYEVNYLINSPSSYPIP